MSESDLDASGRRAHRQGCDHDPMPVDPAAREAWAWRRARRRVRALRGWYLHALIYASVIGGMWLIYLFGPVAHLNRHGLPWPSTPMLGWGLGLALHGLIVWSRASDFGRQWENRKIEQFLREDKGAR